MERRSLAPVWWCSACESCCFFLQPYFFFFCLVSFPRYCANWWSDPLPPIIFPRGIARKIELYCMAKCNMGCKSALLPFQSCRAYSKGLWRVLMHQMLLLLFAGRVLNADALLALAHGINISLFKSSVVPRTSGVLWLSVFKYVNLKTKAPRLMWQLEGEEGVVWELRTALVTDLRKQRLGYHIGFFCYFLFSYLDWKNPLECYSNFFLKGYVIRGSCSRLFLLWAVVVCAHLQARESWMMGYHQYLCL